MSGSRRPSLDQRRKVWKRAKGICSYCSAEIDEKSFHVDHRHPWSAGGKTVLTNLLACCKRCNIAKGVRTEAEFRYLLANGGISWRDREFRLVTASFAGSTERTRGISSPAIGLKNRQSAIARRTRRANGEV